MAESKILTRFEIYDELYNSIPEDIMNMNPPCRYDTFVSCIYNDEDYNTKRCASKIETSMGMNDFMTQFLGNTLSAYCCAAPPSQWTGQLANNQLVPTDKFYGPMGNFSGGEIGSIYYVSNGSLSYSLNNGISIDWILYFEASGNRKDLMSGSVPNGMIGSQNARYTNSFITDNSGYIGVEINFSNITSHNITKLNIVKGYGYGPEVLLTLSKSSTTTNSVIFEAYSSKAVMDYILDNGLKLEIAGTVVGTQEPDRAYTFNLKSASPYIPDTSLNLTNTLYNVPSSRVRLAYTSNPISDNEIVLYTNEFEKKFSTTNATLSNFVLTINSGIHSVATSAINSHNYFFLKVPIEYDYSGYGNYKRVVLYYPLMANSSSSTQKITITTSGSILVGMCNYHTTAGWFWNCEYYHTNSITNIYLPNQLINIGDTISDASVSRNSGQSTRETEFPCTHLLFFSSTNGTRTLNIHDGQDGTTDEKTYGTSRTRICIIPSTVGDFNQLVDMLNQNESENISYYID